MVTKANPQNRRMWEGLEELKTKLGIPRVPWSGAHQDAICIEFGKILQ